MAAARFCSECGARLKIKRGLTLPFRSFCKICSPRYRSIRLVLAVIPFICAAAGFVIGHHASAPDQFHYIGTPLDLSANRLPQSRDSNRVQQADGSIGQTDQLRRLAAGASCGAQTKSGKPCRRKVKAGGACWQHREIQQKTDR